MALSLARARKPAPSTSPRCVLIGPVGAGKSTLLASLRHHADGSHSYIDRFAVEIAAAESALQNLSATDSAAVEAAPPARDAGGRGWLGRKRSKTTETDDSDDDAPPTAPLSRAPLSPECPERAAGRRTDFQEYERRLDHAIRNGLDFEATFTDRVHELSFRLTLRGLTRSGLLRPDRVISEVFRTVDAAGGLLLDDPLDTRGDPQTESARARVGEELLAAENVLLCLPASGFSSNPHRARDESGAAMPPAHRRSLIDLLQGLRQHPQARVRRLVVVLTKFEQAVAGVGREAYRVAATPDYAREVCGASLRDYWGWLTPSLRAFEDETAATVHVQPVSTFGFVPYSGGANLDPRTELLRTRTPPEPDVERTTKTPYTFDAVHAYYWRPFLTLDPFIFVATGEPGYLTFSLSEVLGE